MAGGSSGSRAIIAAIAARGEGGRPESSRSTSKSAAKSPSDARAGARTADAAAAIATEPAPHGAVPPPQVSLPRAPSAPSTPPPRAPPGVARAPGALGRNFGAGAATRDGRSDVMGPAAASASSGGPVYQPFHMISGSRPAESPFGPKISIPNQAFRKFSCFCRDSSVWEALSDLVLFPLAQARAAAGEVRSEIRCWSCGCSTGEEAYSLLMIWRHRVAEHFPSVTLSVLGTDLIEENITACQRGVYPHHSVRDLPSAWLEADFEADVQDTPSRLPRKAHAKACEPEERSYRLREHARCGATFEVQDVLETMPDGRFDLVVSRYAICLYLADEVRIPTLQRILSDKLRPDGYLMIGADDHLPQGLAGQHELQPVYYQHPHSDNPCCDGIFRHSEAPVPTTLQTLQGYLRAQGSEVDWVLDRLEAHKRISRFKMTDKSRAILEQAFQDGRREEAGVLSRLCADMDGRARKEKLKALAESLSTSKGVQLPQQAPQRDPREATQAVQSFLSRLEADEQKRQEREKQTAREEARLRAAPRKEKGSKRRRNTRRSKSAMM
mmetsp:Transcript_135883/g.302481  ORF Transcript_135883/g.302481 Transcript_135883/m.302481 type:complete len:555 (+) Transcript_135883:72-1736(+)